MARALVLALVLLAVLTSLAVAQAPARVRGSVEKLDGQVLTVRSREGVTVAIRLADNYAVVAVTKAALGDITPGVFVGTAALRLADGTLRAQEIVVFPESARGAGEGHYPWDLTPESTMTNATVDAMVNRVDGPVLTLKYKGGEVRVVVPADAPVVTFGPGDRALLAPGAHVFIPGTRQADGTVTATRVLVGTDGLVPPM